MPHAKLFIPGPVEISQATYEAMCSPMIGHRGSEFQQLYADIQPKLQTLFGTAGPVYLSTSSAWGIMEGALRNTVARKVLNCCGGAFSDKWFDVAKRCGKEAEALQVEWGQPILPEQVEARLATGQFDAVTLIHNETSTGVMNPLAEIAAVVRRFPDVLLIVDTVSSFSVVPTPFDELGADVLLTGSQKALALPPGLALFTVSQRAMERATQLTDRGYYFDFHEFHENHTKNMTPSTPCIHTIYGLRQKVEEIFAEGLTRRYERHAKLNTMVHEWVASEGFQHFAPEGYRSKSLTCIANNKGIDVDKLQKLMKQNHAIAIDGGYGKIKGKTFRLSNMGNETEESITILLNALDESLSHL
jgi:aspartate aminotransferase-like enzyme